MSITAAHLTTRFTCTLLPNRLRTWIHTAIENLKLVYNNMNLDLALNSGNTRRVGAPVT